MNIKNTPNYTPVGTHCRSRGISRPAAGLLLLILLFPLCGVKTEPEAPVLREKLVGLAQSLSGLPYRYGGDEIDGFDCSGFVFYVYDSFGVKAPRTAVLQARMNKRIKFKNARPGDMLVFKLNHRWHTGIFLGENTFIHAPHRNSRIRKESINDYWKKRLKYTVRVLNE